MKSKNTKKTEVKDVKTKNQSETKSSKNNSVTKETNTIKKNQLFNSFFSYFKDPAQRIKIELGILIVLLPILGMILISSEKSRNNLLTSLDFIKEYENLIYWTLIILIITIIFIIIYWLIPKLQTRSLRDKIYSVDQSPFERESNRISLEDNLRKTSLQLITGLFLLLALINTYNTFILSSEGHITDRFSKAVEHLGSENIAVRLGGLYALERISKDSEKDYWTIVEIISAFVREQTQDETAVINKDNNLEESNKPPQSESLNTKLSNQSDNRISLRNTSKSFTDVQAALIILGRLPRIKGEIQDRIDLTGANLVNNKIINSDFSYGFFIEANLSKSEFALCNFTQANFREALIKKADFSASNLNRAFLSNANLSGTDFTGADLTDANFDNANLKGAILKSKGLKFEQLAVAIIDYETELVADLNSRREELLRMSAENLKRLGKELSKKDFDQRFGE